jgi:hypothetical protein
LEKRLKRESSADAVYYMSHKQPEDSQENITNNSDDVAG